MLKLNHWCQKNESLISSCSVLCLFCSCVTQCLVFLFLYIFSFLCIFSINKWKSINELPRSNITVAERQPSRKINQSSSMNQISTNIAQQQESISTRNKSISIPDSRFIFIWRNSCFGKFLFAFGEGLHIDAFHLFSILGGGHFGKVILSEYFPRRGDYNVLLILEKGHILASVEVESLMSEKRIFDFILFYFMSVLFVCYWKSDLSFLSFFCFSTE